MPDLSSLTVYRLLARVAIVPMAVAGLIGIARLRKLPLNLRYLAIGIGSVLFPINLLSVVLMIQQRKNLFLMPFYSVAELGILVLVYRNALQWPAFSRLAPWLIGGYTCYVAADSLLTDSGLTRFQPGPQVAQSILVLVLVVLYFRKLLNDLLIVSLTRDPMFWVSVGLLIYFTGYLLIALFSNYLLIFFSQKASLTIWSINSLLFMFLYYCYCRAFWLPAQEQAT